MKAYEAKAQAQKEDNKMKEDKKVEEILMEEDEGAINNLDGDAEELDLEEEDDNDQAEEFLEADTDTLKRYMRWMQLQSAYWIVCEIVTAPKTLSMIIPDSFKIFILNVKHPSNDERKMISWKTLISDLFPAVRVSKIIETIKNHINRHLVADNCHSIFKKYSPPHYRPKRFSGNLHAEALLALLPRSCCAEGGEMVWILSCSYDIH